MGFRLPVFILLDKQYFPYRQMKIKEEAVDYYLKFVLCNYDS